MGYRTSLVESAPGGIISTTTFGYDALGRMTSATTRPWEMP